MRAYGTCSLGQPVLRLRVGAPPAAARRACPASSLAAAAHRLPPSLPFLPPPPPLRQDSFFKQLRSAPDGFALVAEYFGRGLLNNTSVSQQGG